MAVAAFVVALLGLVVAVLSLGWQIAAWRLEGPRLRLALKQGVVGPGGVAEARVGRDHNLRDMSSMRAQGWTGPDVIGVEVTNLGRTRVQVTRFSIMLKRGEMSVGYPGSNSLSPSLPHWIEPQTTATWYAELQDGVALIDVLRRSQPDRRAGGLAMQVELGHGKQQVTRQWIEI